MTAIPTFLAEQLVGIIDQRQDGRLFSKVDAGPSKVRRRFTAVSRYVTVPLRLDGAQRQAFDTFYETDLLEGTLPFDWEDPVTDEVVSFRALEGTPQFTLTEGGGPDGSRRWEAVWALEILP